MVKLFDLCGEQRVEPGEMATLFHFFGGNGADLWFDRCGFHPSLILIHHAY